MNGHINNVTYLAWALETVPQETHDGRRLAEVEIDFKAECLAGQTIESLASPTPAPAPSPAGATAFVHELRRCDGDKCYELVRARSVWVAR